MIKRFVFCGHQTLAAPELEASWLEALARRTTHAPAALRPLHAAVCIALQVDDIPVHAGVSIEWFADSAALQRHRAWEHDSASPLSAADIAGLAPGSRIEVVAREVVLRGAAWLDQRWQRCGLQFKHMALARRAPGLTAAELSERWRSRPGQVGGGQTPSLAIPEAAKGSAYCQNHPLPDCQEPAYDAINEVYFDRLEDMRPRLEFFRDHPVAQLDADLVSEPRFLVVRERIVDGI